MTKTVKAKVSKPRKKQRTSKGSMYPFEVWSVDDDGFYHVEHECMTKEIAEEYLLKGHRFVAPVILHIDIPPVKY